MDWCSSWTHHLDNLCFAFVLSATFQVVLSPFPLLLQIQTRWGARMSHECKRLRDRCWDLKQRQLTSFSRALSSLSCREYRFTSSFSRFATIFFSQEEHSCLSLTTAENLENKTHVRFAFYSDTPRNPDYWFYAFINSVLWYRSPLWLLLRYILLDSSAPQLTLHTLTIKLQFDILTDAELEFHHVTWPQKNLIHDYITSVLKSFKTDILLEMLNLTSQWYKPPRNASTLWRQLSVRCDVAATPTFSPLFVAVLPHSTGLGFS